MAQKHVQQQDFNDLPLLNIVTEAVSANFTGGDLINGKLGYNVTSNELITVISNVVAKILTSGDIATGIDIQSKTADKVLTADKVKITGDTILNPNQELASIGKVNELISLNTAEGVRDQGGLAGNADLTGNSTGNAYLDGSNSVILGDMFRITSDGSLTVTDGTLAVKAGRILRVINSVADASITLADLFLDAVVDNAINVSFDNSNSNLTSFNVEAAIKEVDAKFADSFYTVNSVAFTAKQVQTITHNLNSASVECKVAVAGSGVFKEQGINSANRTVNSFEIQIDVAGTYDFVVRDLTKA